MSWGDRIGIGPKAQKNLQAFIWPMRTSVTSFNYIFQFYMYKNLMTYYSFTI